MLPALPNLELSLTQQFELRKYEQSSVNLSKEELRKLLMQAVRLVMVKDNVTKYLLRELMTGNVID